MGKRNLLLIVTIMLWSVGFSQSAVNKFKIYIGDSNCIKQVELTRIQLIKSGKFTVIANEKDTVQSVSYTMQLLKGEDLSEKLVAKSSFFTPRMKSFFVYNKYEAKTKKIWIENFKLEYKGDTIMLPSFTIMVKD